MKLNQFYSYFIMCNLQRNKVMTSYNIENDNIKDIYNLLIVNILNNIKFIYNIMDELDLDINNYSLNDILKLFNLKKDFTEEDLKEAKKKVLMTHPDKSRLKKEVFLFFSSAYKLIYKIHKFRTKSSEPITNNNVYIADNIDCEEDNKALWEKLSKHKQFNTFFNEMFEKNISKISNNNDGYGEWFKTEETILVAKNSNEMNTFIDERKKELRNNSIMLYKEVSDNGEYYGTDLVKNNNGYKSNMFSSLQYDDLKQAYTESVVPVSMEDYETYKKYNDINELRHSRDVDKYSYKSNHRVNKNVEEEDIARAFQLAKQDEEIRNIKTKMASNFLKLLN